METTIKDNKHSMAKKPATAGNFYASQIPENEAYYKYAAVMKDEAQRRNWAFREAIT